MLLALVVAAAWATWPCAAGATASRLLLAARRRWRRRPPGPPLRRPPPRAGHRAGDGLAARPARPPARSAGGGPAPIAGLLGLTDRPVRGRRPGHPVPEGGGLEWGGRFLSPILVPIAVLAAAGLARALDSVPAEADRRYATALLAALGVVTAVFALATAGSLRAREDGIVAALDRHPATVTVTTRPAYPRIAWRADDRLTWMLTDDARLPTLLEHLAPGRASTSTSSCRRTPRSFGEVVDEPALRDDGMKMVSIRAE